MSEEMRELARKAADELLGTCKHIEMMEEYEGAIWDQAFGDELDAHVMLCSACEWWCETGDLNDEGECSDCADDEDDD
jgi:hypothetical protein